MKDSNLALDTSFKSEWPQRKRNTSGLIPYQPGQSGNPGGKPKGPSVTSQLMRILSEAAKGKGKTNDVLIAETLVSLAKRKDFRATKAIEMVMDRVDGKVPERIDVTKRSISFDSEDLLQFMEALDSRVEPSQEVIEMEDRGDKKLQ